MSQPDPFDQGPYLSAAFFCEKILMEQDGVKSAIRIVDRITHRVAGPNPPDEMAPFQVSVTFLLRLKAGRIRGAHPVEVRMVKPSGDSPTPFRQTLFFEGEDDRGVDLLVDMRLELDQAGVHWFNVVFEGMRLTRIPLRVIYIPQITPGLPQPGSP